MGDGKGPAEPGGFDPSATENVSPPVAWLVSEESSGVTGRVFNILGGSLSVAESWYAGPGAEIGARFDPAALGEVVSRLVAEAAPNADPTGRVDRAVSGWRSGGRASPARPGAAPGRPRYGR